MEIFTEGRYVGVTLAPDTLNQLINFNWRKILPLILTFCGTWKTKFIMFFTHRPW